MKLREDEDALGLAVRLDYLGLRMTRSPPQTELYAVLRGALEDAVRMVPEVKRSSSLKACLAEKMLILAARGERNPSILSRLAVLTVQDSCHDCYGCEKGGSLGGQPRNASRAL